MKEHLTSLINMVRILLILEKEEGWKEVNFDASSEQVYKEVSQIPAGSHTSSTLAVISLRVIFFDEIGSPGTPALSTVWI